MTEPPAPDYRRRIDPADVVGVALLGVLVLGVPCLLVFAGAVLLAGLGLHPVAAVAAALGVEGAALAVAFYTAARWVAEQIDHYFDRRDREEEQS